MSPPVKGLSSGSDARSGLDDNDAAEKGEPSFGIARLFGEMVHAPGYELTWEEELDGKSARR